MYYEAINLIETKSTSYQSWTSDNIFYLESDINVQNTVKLAIKCKNGNNDMIATTFPYHVRSHVNAITKLVRFCFYISLSTCHKCERHDIQVLKKIIAKIWNWH